MRGSWSSASQELEFSMEMSSEVPGTNVNWPSDISIWVNGVKVGTWTSPGDFGDKRGTYTPRWWKLAGSQYGRLVTWRISERGSFVDKAQVSKVDIGKLELGQASLDPPAHRHRRGREASGRRQHLRQGLRQPRPGHPDADASGAGVISRETPPSS